MTIQTSRHFLSLKAQLKQMLAAVMAEPVFPIKAISASICIIGCLLYLPLGVVLFGCFVYVHIILRNNGAITQTSTSLSPSSPKRIFSPVDGVVVSVQQTADGIGVYLRSNMLDNHMVLTPIAGEIEQVIHFSGRFEPVNLSSDKMVFPEQNMRYEFWFSHQDQTQLKMHILSHPFCRFITAFSEEGRWIEKGQPISVGLLCPLIYLELPHHTSLNCRQGQRCLAGDTVLAELS